MKHSLLIILIAVLPMPAAPPRPTVRPEPRAETQPVTTGGDSADDPAVWSHPTDPEKGLILGTNKQGGLHVYGFDGKELQVIDGESRPNNVDVLYDFPLGDRRVDLAVTTSRRTKTPGVKVYLIDPDARRLSDVTAGGTQPVFGGKEPYGVCVYRSAKSGKSYAFVNHKDGRVEQAELIAAADGKVALKAVRTFKLRSQPEGMVADDEAGVVYVGEEAWGVWKFAAEPDAGARGKLIAKVGDDGLTHDVEGLALYRAAGGKGYLIVSSQGSNTFNVYEREGDNRYVLTVDPAAGKLGKPIDTDGIVVCNRPAGKQFPKGVFVVQDGRGSGRPARQNFKLYGWEDVAGDKLLIDPEWSPCGR